MSQISPTEADVIIVGAGPAGLTAACELTRHGVHCRIVEQRVAPTHYSQACILYTQTQEIFKALGLLQDWMHTGYPLEHIVTTVAGKHLGTLLLRDSRSPDTFPLMIGQNIIERLLIEQLHHLGIKVERPHMVVGFEQDNNGVHVTLLHPDDSPETIHARWLISADGSRSPIRKSLGIPFIGERYAHLDFIQADAHIRWSYPHGEGRVFLTHERFVACFPFNKDGYYRIVCTHGHHDTLHNDTPTEQEIQAILRSVSDPEATLYEVNWLNRLHPQHRHALTFRQGRTFLVGEAGHTHMPIASHGMNTAIQDAFNLGWKLAAVIHGQAQPSLLDSYHTERQTVAKTLQYGSDLSFKLLAQPVPLVSSLLSSLTPFALHNHTLQQWLRTTLIEHNGRYKESPLVVNAAARGEIRAGERARDATVVRRRDMRTLHLFELLQGIHWTLLFFSGRRSTDAEIQRNFAQLGQEIKDRYRTLVEPHLVIVNPDTYIPWGGSLLIDRDHVLYETYGIQDPCIYLIRPDRYIGFYGRATDGQRLLDYLANVLHEQCQPTAPTPPLVTY